MKQNYKKSTLITITLIAVFIYSTLNTGVVFADDETPPPAPTEEPGLSSPTVDDTPADDSTQVDEAPAAISDTLDQPSTEEPNLSSPTTDTPTDDSIQVDGAPAAASDTLDQPSTEELILPSPTDTVNDSSQIVEEPTTVSDILDQLPMDTTVVVMIDGQVEPLVTQDAAQAIVPNDPWWCPGTAAPGSAGCATGSGTFSALTGAGGLINWMLVNATSGGTIWIADTYDSNAAGEAATITINGSAAWTNPAVPTNFLTIQGGWNGTVDGSGIITATPSVFTGDAFRVINWQNTVTINNIAITGATGTGLTVTTSGAINLGNVQSIGNTLYGANLNNTSGVSNSGVTLTGTNTFSNNVANDGLRISSNGDIALNEVTTNGNGTYGTYLNNSTGSGRITLTGINKFNGNVLNDGLRISSTGAINLSNITAEGNGAYGLRAITNGNILLNDNVTANGNMGTYGAYLDNEPGTGCISLNGATNTFGGNVSYGLRAISTGTITLSNVTANGNGTYGAYLINTSSVTNSGVILSGTNTFNNNVANDGLRIFSKGAITLNDNVTANGNGAYGAFLNNSTGSGDVAVKGTANIFSGNVLNDGLRISSNGNIDLNNVTANRNMGAAAYGLRVVSPGTITLNNIYANENGTYGAYLNNTTSSTNNGVALNGTNTFNNNVANDGLRVLSDGSITLNNVTAERNGTYGVNLDNNPGIGGVTLSGPNNFSNNYLTGLQVSTTGDIIVSSVIANSNGITGNANPTTGYGANLSTATGNVSVIGTNSFSANYSTGLNVVTAGTITVSSVTADGNGTGKKAGYGYGAYVNNTSSSSNTIVTLTGANVFSSNYLTGLYILSDGLIDASASTAITASSNGGYGAWLNNTTGTSGITINGAGIFNGNTQDGLNAQTNGDLISATGLTTNDNSGYGAYLKNSTGTGMIRLDGNNVFNGNTLDGLNTTSSRSITIDSITAGNNAATGNGGYGAWLNNTTGTGGITINGAGIFNGNTLDGLNAQTNGDIANTAGLSANDNSGYGAYLKNSTGTGMIRLDGNNVFNHNAQDGLYIVSKGEVTLNNITAGTNVVTGNGGNGASLDNSAGSGDVNLNGAGIFNGNSSSGLKIFSNGAISLANITASNNVGGYGAYLSAQGAGNAVTLNGTNIFNNNRLDGLYIDANGNIVIFNATANSNGANGFFLQSTANISLNYCTNAANNGGAGASADLPGIFFLRMGDFSGNGSRKFSITGGGIKNVDDCIRVKNAGQVEEDGESKADKPIHKVNLISEQTVLLECVAFSGTTLILPNGDSAYLPCPISDKASLASLTEADLKDALPEGTAFTSGYNLQVSTEAGSVGGEELTSIGETMTISFVIPESQLNADLAVLFWNGSKWIEVEGAMMENGHLNAQIDFDGLFILVSK